MAIYAHPLKMVKVSFKPCFCQLFIVTIFSKLHTLPYLFVGNCAKIVLGERVFTFSREWVNLRQLN